MLQQRWLTKLMSFDYSIVYKRGIDNKVADAPSRKKFKAYHTTELNAISVVQRSWLEEIRGGWENDEVVQVLTTKLITGSYANDTLRYQGKLYVGRNGGLRQKIIEELHNSGSGGILWG